MGRLLDLLNAAAGEESLHSAIGRWRQAVSDALDTIGGGVSAAIAVLQTEDAALQSQITSLQSDVMTLLAEIELLKLPLKYIQVFTGPGPFQAGITVNTDILLQTVITSTPGITYDNTTGIYTLAVGRTYLMEATLHFDNFSDTANNFVVAWVDADTDLPFFFQPGAVITPAQAVNESPAIPSVQTILAADATNNRVKLRVVSVFGGGGAGTADDEGSSIARIVELR